MLNCGMMHTSYITFPIFATTLPQHDILSRKLDKKENAYLSGNENFVVFGFFLSCYTAGGLSGFYVYAELSGAAFEWKSEFPNIEDDAFGLY
jgi:hypothetical protein